MEYVGLFVAPILDIHKWDRKTEKYKVLRRSAGR